MSEMDQKIINYIKEEFHSGKPELEIFPEDDLLGGGLVESMGMMRLIQFLEEEFSLTIPPQDMTVVNFMTVEAMVNYIKKTKN